MQAQLSISNTSEPPAVLTPTTSADPEILESKHEPSAVSSVPLASPSTPSEPDEPNHTSVVASFSVANLVTKASPKNQMSGKTRTNIIKHTVSTESVGSPGAARKLILPPPLARPFTPQRLQSDPIASILTKQIKSPTCAPTNYQQMQLPMMQNFVPQDPNSFRMFQQPFYSMYQQQPMPLPQPIVSRGMSSPLINAQQKDQNSDAMRIPEPIYLKEKDYEEYGVRCVCGKGNVENTLIVQCDKCDFWLHGVCVNIAMESKSEPFICPFCQHQVIRCNCNKPMDYTLPLIQCEKCQNWVHKCHAGLEFGANPEHFVCEYCGVPEYYIKDVCFDANDLIIPDTKVFVDVNRQELLDGIPDGQFKNLIVEDLEKSELDFREIVPKYFNHFATLLFDRAHEFWRTFNDTLCKMLKVERQVLLAAIDTLAMKFIYAPYKKPDAHKLVTHFEHSESITNLLESTQITRMERAPRPAKLYVDSNNKVRSVNALEEGAFIAELPGFLMHTDEMRVENGIPLSSLVVTDWSVIIDLTNSSFKYAPLIRRSFHFNCIVKIVKINGEPRVGLFATRIKGPLSEEKSRRGPAIPADGELFLPFDGEIPFPVPKCEWKDKKQRIRPQPKPQESSKSKSRRQVTPPPPKELRPKLECNVQLSLLSSFLDDEVPPLPFILLPDRESVIKYKLQMELKAKMRNNKKTAR